MPRGELLLTLWVLLVESTSGEDCISRPRISVVEGEPFYLKCCSSSSAPENEAATLKWYRSTPPHQRTELHPGPTARITLHKDMLEFWPVKLEDQGSYFCQLGNDTQEWMLNVIRRNNQSCFTEKQVKSQTVRVRKSLQISCSNSYYRDQIHRTSLYKNCKKIAESHLFYLAPLLKNAEFEDQGYYSCVFSLRHDGKLYSITKTLNVTVVKDPSEVIPVILGPKLTQVEVELGEDVELNCSALLNEKDYFYWIFQKENASAPNVHEDHRRSSWTLEGKLYASRILRIKKISEDNLNVLYNCTVSSTRGTDSKSFILLRKGAADIPGHVFTGGMIAATVVSVAVLCLAVMCVIYRVDLVLCYRRWTGRDETLTDGKTYDAFVSYLRDCQPEDGEEYTFAVETLPTALEKHFGYKLCIFERDVEPGGGCFIQKLLWTYCPGKEEEFVLFCDTPEPQRSRLFPGNQHNRTQGPRALPCAGGKDLVDVRWYRQHRDGGPVEAIAGGHSHVTQRESTLHFSSPEAAQAGTYICRARIRSAPDVQVTCCLKTLLEVAPQTTAPCAASAPHKQYLLLGTVGSIRCPRLSCRGNTHRPEVTWYQNGRVLPGEKSDSILLEDIYDYHQGTYVCDYTVSPNVTSWTARAVVQVRTIVADTKFKPDIVYPAKDTLEVELGKPLTLPCTVRFGFQRDLHPVIRWYIKSAGQQWEFPTFQEKSVKSTMEEEVMERVIFLKEVTQSDLGREFLCFAQNSIGNVTRSLRLQEKRGVLLFYVLLGTVSILVGVLAAGVLVYTYWIEILLLYQTCQRKGETLGVYSEDIVNVIKKSRRGIFILSPNYLNGPQLFELQAAVNLALNDQMLKLILIKFCSFQEPESLPLLVKKALRVLPTITWRGLKSVAPNSRFWTQVRCHMPVKS
ncbi:interleukin-18 receptor accessory protein isoform X3 [Cavia porcellus]|uniref:interleukin-18 receptor accessory protein isoform X3 n=1 Tax=Cavia porcellus TaxID=10141 RepID=UPI002FE00D04